MGDMSVETFFVVQADDGSQYVEAFSRDCSMFRFFRTVSRTIAFYDCSSVDVVKIVFQGVEYTYDGWKPGELYTYHVVRNPNVKWEGCFPEFNH